MNARTRKYQVERLTWGDNRRCPTGRHAYAMEEGEWIDGDGKVVGQTRWHCWSCGHWQNSPPIGTFEWMARQAMKALPAGSGWSEIGATVGRQFYPGFAAADLRAQP